MSAGFQFFRITGAQDTPDISLSGDWTLANFRAIEQEIARLQQRYPRIHWHPDGLAALDTSGASLITRLPGNTDITSWQGQLPAQQYNLLALMERARKESPALPPSPPVNPFLAWLSGIGKTTSGVWQALTELLSFMGQVLATLVASLWRPSRWRITPLLAGIETGGVNAIPIVALLTFLVGAVIAFLGASLLTRFGAGHYTVSLVVFAFLREFAVLLTAIIVAGRTASAYTAQIGAMKASEEIDALKVSGLDPVEILVLPRVLAMMVALPALTFIAMICGIAGGIVVCLGSLDMPLALILSLIQENIDVRHFYVGISKAPVFAFIVAIIGCLQGFNVRGSATSVGEKTTTSVVHSIFMVILLDAFFALFFMEAGW
ncbi:ABC transporter [Shimwellia blattae DSM 4481 = NBRC 105725]|uniref:ABC transporter n=1 Tax=Shimwellia blattae (strain ATCC 29907 / DSM 4481 / JCM 1650 / NBRC 105725 / CDC 9005-74) TaxID=630626 RepID=I2B9K0_SHIBC|nr:ABC transporter permease [Shimwellia blattae]AFJ47204.1 ABC transporter [Shimwellia blattae DSM 4481 = NBRC 105725]GAB82267.1 putative ABC transporter permease protein [Shimwellia blattae DSM 4481 = NBRC 105725]VEC22796.1 Probable phospholipid ABC transporter permease protein mlaE [Shimwellia blattae]